MNHGNALTSYSRKARIPSSWQTQREAQRQGSELPPKLGCRSNMVQIESSGVRSSANRSGKLGGNMPKTVVALFKNPTVVEEVVREIEKLGIPKQEVRTVEEPATFPVSGS